MCTESCEKRAWCLRTFVVAIVAMVMGAGIYWAVATRPWNGLLSSGELENGTICGELQNVVDSLLRDKMDSIGAVQGQVIVMEVKTGRILSMVGLERNFEGKYQPCNNFAYQQEPGSLIEPVSLLAVMESGKAGLGDCVFTEHGAWQVDSVYELKDHNWHRGGYGTLTMSQVLEQSSNIGVGKFVTNAFGNDRLGFYGMLDRICYGQPDSIEDIDGLKATEYCLLKDSIESNRYFLESTIGYERKVAPIQLLTFYNAIANGGNMVKPTLKKGVTETINRQIASKSSIDSIQLALENVVVYGLAHKAGTPLVSVAGKHGTAVVNQKKNMGIKLGHLS